MNISIYFSEALFPSVLLEFRLGDSQRCDSGRSATERSNQITTFRTANPAPRRSQSQLQMRRDELNIPRPQ